MTLPNLSGLSRKKTFVKKAQSADVGVGEGNALSNERGVVPSPVPATPDVIYHPELQRGLNRLSNRGLSRVQPVPKFRGETAPLCYEPGAFARNLPRFYTAPDTRFPPGEKVDTFERVQNGDTVCDALRKSEFGWMESPTRDLGSFYLPYNVTYTGPPKQEAVAQVRIDNYYFSGDLRNQKSASTMRFEGIQGQEKLVEADVDEHHLFLQFGFRPNWVGQVPNMTVNMENKLLLERAAAYHFSTLRVELFDLEGPTTENRLIVKDNSVWIRTMFNCDLIIEFPLMGNRTTESDILVYLMSASNAFEPLELYSQYLPEHDKEDFYYPNAHTMHLRKEPDLQTKEYIKSELRKIDGHPITKRIMGLLEDGKCKWNRDYVKTDRPDDVLLVCLFIILLSFDARDDFAGLKRLAARILRIKEEMVKPVWAWILERDRMLRRAAAYQLGV